MAFPSCETLRAFSGSSAATSHQVPMPATISDGAVLVVYGRVAAAGTVSFPAGWTVAQDSSDASDDVTFWAYRTTRAISSEGGALVTVTHGSGKMAAISAAYLDAGDPSTNPPIGSSVAIGTDSAPNSPSLDTGSQKEYEWVSFHGGDGEHTVTSYPLGDDDQNSANSGTGGAAASNCVVGVCHGKPGLGAGGVQTYDPAAYGLSIAVANGWTAYTIAIPPGSQASSGTAAVSAAGSSETAGRKNGAATGAVDAGSSAESSGAKAASASASVDGSGSVVAAGQVQTDDRSGSASVSGATSIRTWRGAPRDPDLPRAFSGKLSLGSTNWAVVEAAPDGTTLYAGYYASAQFHVRRSDDQGRTWGAPVSFAASDSVLERCLHVTASGIVHVFYRNGGALQHRRSTDRGATWSSPFDLHTSAVTFWRAGFASDGQTLHVVYGNDGSMFYRRSTDDGASWGTQVEPYNRSGAYGNYSRPSITCAGSVVVITCAASELSTQTLIEEDIVTGRSTDAGATWDPLVVHTEPEAFFAHRPDVHAISSTVMLLAWQEGSNRAGTTQANGWLDIVMRRSTDAGATWGPPTKMLQGNAAGTLWRHEHAWIASRGDRVVLVAGCGDATNANMRTTVRLSQDAGVTWTDRQITMDSSPVAAPTATISRDLVHVTTNDYSGTTWYQGARWNVTKPATAIARLLDDFDRADGAIGSNWTAGTIFGGTAGPPVIVSNAATKASGGAYRQGGYWNARTFGYDVIVVGEFSALNGTQYDEVTFEARLVGSGTAGADGVITAIWRDTVAGAYRARLGGVTNTAESGSVSGTSDLPAFSAGTKYVFVAEGVLLRLWVQPGGTGDWQLYLEAMNEAWPRQAGNVGVQFTRDQTARLSTLYADTLVDEQRFDSASVSGVDTVAATGEASQQQASGTASVEATGAVLTEASKGAASDTSAQAGGAVATSGERGAADSAQVSAGLAVDVAAGKGGEGAASAQASSSAAAEGGKGGESASGVDGYGEIVASGFVQVAGEGAAVVLGNGLVQAAGEKSAVSAPGIEGIGEVVAAGNAVIEGSGAAVVLGEGAAQTSGLKASSEAAAAEGYQILILASGKGGESAASAQAASSAAAEGGKGGESGTLVEGSGQVASAGFAAEAFVGAAEVSATGSVATAGAKNGRSPAGIEGIGDVVSTGQVTVAGQGAAVVTAGGLAQASGLKASSSGTSSAGGSTVTISAAKSASGGTAVDAALAAAAVAAKNGQDAATVSGLGTTSTSGMAEFAAAGVVTVAGAGSASAEGLAGRQASASIADSGSAITTATKAAADVAFVTAAGSVAAEGLQGEPSMPPITDRTRSRPGGHHTYVRTGSGRTRSRRV